MQYEDYFIKGDCRCSPERGQFMRSLPEDQLAELAAWALLTDYGLTETVPSWCASLNDLKGDEYIKLVKALIELIEEKRVMRSLQ